MFLFVNKMNVRYEFSQETYPSLRLFLEKCKGLKSKVDVENEKTWRILLPKNEHLINQLKEKPEEEVILIQNSESPTAEIDNDEDVTTSLSNTQRDIDKSKIEDIARVITEELNSNERIMEVVLNLTEAELQELFIHLGRNESVNSETVCALGENLAACKMLGNDKVLKYFCRHLLIKELREKENVRNIFLTFLSSNPNIVCAELAKYCISIGGNDNFPRDLHEILKYLEGAHRELLLREFVLNCAKVEQSHFSFIEALVVGQMDFGVLKKLMSLFSASSIEYGTNKLFGKLLLHVLQKIGNQVYRFETDVQNIMAHHKSLYSNKILKTYESNVGNISHSSMTQIT